MRTVQLFLLGAIGMASCAMPDKQSQQSTANAEELLTAKLLAYHFENGRDSLNVGFRMRGKEYAASFQNGNFEYSRQYSDSLGVFRGNLTNSGFSETLNGERMLHNVKDSAGRAGSINSVVYFSLLPLFLEDDAVNMCCLEPEIIDGKPYDRMEVKFSQVGGGNDHDDVYLYWIDPLDGSMDFLAYSFRVNEGGTRFRKAINPRRINGVLFQDYVNFKGPADPDSLPFISAAYRENNLDTLSVIELENLSVTYLKK